MKVLLTSAGFENAKVSDVFMGLLTKDPKDSTVVFIPTAANSAASIAMLPKCMNDLLRIGINPSNITVYDLHYKMKYRVLKDYDAVYVCGGSTDYLLQRVNKTGFRQVLLRYIQQDGVYVGVSAGSYIAANNVKRNLGVFDKMLAVHCEQGEPAGIANAAKDRISLTDKQALLIRNSNDISVIE